LEGYLYRKETKAQEVSSTISYFLLLVYNSDMIAEAAVAILDHKVALRMQVKSYIGE
jgi:hypothetical protein